MTSKEVEITFDHPTAIYYPGSTVSGQLTLRLEKPKKFKEIEIKMKGKGGVFWVEKKRGTRSQYVKYSAKEIYFEKLLKVFNGSGERELPRGEHVYKFSSVLPQKLPGSYSEMKGAFVKYRVKATLFRSWKLNMNTRATFTVVSPLNLDLFPQTKVPIAVNSTESVGSRLHRSGGAVTLYLNAPARGFAQGQTIPVTVSVENNSEYEVLSVLCSLKKVVTLKSMVPRPHTKIFKYNLGNVELGSVAAHGRNTFSGKVQVPALTHTNMMECNVIDINYKLQVKAKMGGSILNRKGVKIFVPVLLGNLPHQPSAPQ